MALLGQRRAGRRLRTAEMGSHEVHTGSWSHQSTSRSTATGEATHEYSGRPAHGEIDTLNACERLMEALVPRRGVALMAGALGDAELLRCLR